MLVNFKSIPFFRLLAPYVVGIIFHELNFPEVFNNVSFWFSATLVVTCFLLSKFFIKQSRQLKLIYSISVQLFLFFLPFKTFEYYKENINQHHYSNYLSQYSQKTIGVIKDISYTKSKLAKLTLSINAIELNNNWKYCNGKTIVYVKNNSDKNLSIGNEILIQSKYNPIVNNGNPNEFDYKKFMERKNIFHTVFVNGEKTHYIKQSNDLSIVDYGSKLKNHIVTTLRESNLSQNAFSICSALIVGYDDEIDSEVINSFSHSGTLHMLSVSGLHTGVIYSILVFLFSFIDKNNRFNFIKTLVIVLCLFLFVLITGISPSVLRASLMFSLIIIGKTFYRESNSYNTLFLSAFILLFVNPYLIYDIGFLLSYTAVFGIIFLYPKLNDLLVLDNKILKWLWNGASVSIAATVFTLPITLYYFHQFPVWFIFSNLIIIPIGLLIMFGGIILILLSKITFANTLLVFLINYATEIMLWLTKLTNNNSIGYIDNIAFGKIDVLFLIFIFVCLIFSFYYKTYRYVMTTLVASVMWCVLSIFNFLEQQHTHSSTFLNINKKRVYVIQKGNNVLINAIDSINNNDFERSIKPSIVNVSSLNYQIVSLKNMAYEKVLFTSDIFISTSGFNTSFFLPEKSGLSQNSPQLKNYSFIVSSAYTNKKSPLLQNYYDIKKNGALIVNLD